VRCNYQCELNQFFAGTTLLQLPAPASLSAALPVLSTDYTKEMVVFLQKKERKWSCPSRPDGSGMRELLAMPHDALCPRTNRALPNYLD
jgi:hypothetical protein